MCIDNDLMAEEMIMHVGNYSGKRQGSMRALSKGCQWQHVRDLIDYQDTRIDGDLMDEEM